MMATKAEMIKYYSFCFFFYFVFVMWIPLVYSDWQWHSAYGVKAFHNNFVDVNGRYLSNLLEFYAVKYEPIRWFTYSSISVFLVTTIVGFVKVRHKGLYFMLAFGLMLIIPSSLFKYTYGWFEGFYNYVPATACMIYSLWYVITIFSNFSTLTKKHHIIFYSVSLSGQLFLEQVTFFNVLSILCALITYGIKFKYLSPKLTLGCILTLIGMFIMYVNTSYDRLTNAFKILQSSNDFAALALRSYQNLTITISKGVFFNNIIILTLIAIVIIILLAQSATFQNSGLWEKIIIYGGLVVFPCYSLIIYQSFNFRVYEHFIILNILNFTIILIFLITAIVAINYLEIAKSTKLTLYILDGSLIFLMASFSFYNKIEQGYFYITYVIWVIILLILLSQLEIERGWFKIAINSVVISLCCAFVSIMFYIDYKNDARIGQLKFDYHRNPLATSYKVERLPFEQFLLQATPNNKKYEKLFKQYWNIPQEIKIKFVPYHSVKRDDI